MMRKMVAAILISTLFLPWASAVARNAGQTPPPSYTASRAQTNSDPAQGSQTARPQPRSKNRSYQRETRTWHGISKKEWVFLGAVAGTCMGIGALAGGGKGLAIGAIVGGWGAYLGHRIWKRVK